MVPQADSQPPRVALPPELHNSDGIERVVGVEMELAGLGLDEILARVSSSTGGRIDRTSDYEGRVLDTPLGDIRVELDASLFRDRKLRDFLKHIGVSRISDDLGDSIEEFMASEARRFVPYEVIFPPVSLTRLGELEAVREGLVRGSEGTNASFFNAFGLHLNPELPAVDVGTVVRYLRAFLVLFEHLRELHDVDYTRRISPFIDPFPKEYLLMVLNPDYSPGADGLIDDYISFNPTRNRPLDLLPVLSWMEAERVSHHLPDEKISRRPALHYRLPNCQVDEGDWSITVEWNRWAEVEKLAADPDLLHEAMGNVVPALESPIRNFLENFWK
ncbi:MAG: amidoligase family protein [Candidatus Sumerlaeia bacterium]|nr:amidoligase family protein [Candidatus Sumerlaeia bacterium]